MQADLEEITVDQLRNILNIRSTQLRQDLLLKKDAGATHHNNNKIIIIIRMASGE